MPTFTPDLISWTTQHLLLGFAATDTVLSNATGFIYQRAGLFYLVTNWHVVSGRHPTKGECLSESKGVPDLISTLFRPIEQFSVTRRESLALFADDAMREPLWYEHPRQGRAVDVVAIPLAEQIAKSYQLSPINAIEFDIAFESQIADDAFVIGYPFSDVTQFALPIWKRASVATEPQIDIDGLPKLLIDTATRSGLSGSPVIMQRVSVHGMSGDELQGNEIIGRIRNFIGVYSGRIGRDELKAQLGIVWKAKVIEEIIDARVLGKPPHSL